MSSPKDAKQLVAPYLDLLAEKIREKNFTELEVQEALGWGRSYISQLKVGLKHLHVAEVLSILDVIGVEPADFFGELYGSDREPGVSSS